MNCLGGLVCVVIECSSWWGLPPRAKEKMIGDLFKCLRVLPCVC